VHAFADEPRRQGGPARGTARSEGLSS